MDFIKHGNQRINLETISSYKPKGNREILFSTIGTDTNKYIIWKFNTEEDRDRVLNKIDDYSDLKDFAPESHQTENAEINENLI